MTIRDAGWRGSAIPSAVAREAADPRLGARGSRPPRWPDRPAARRARIGRSRRPQGGPPCRAVGTSPRPERRVATGHPAGSVAPRPSPLGRAVAARAEVRRLGPAGRGGVCRTGTRCGRPRPDQPPLRASARRAVAGGWPGRDPGSRPGTAPPRSTSRRRRSDRGGTRDRTSRAAIGRRRARQEMRRDRQGHGRTRGAAHVAPEMDHRLDGPRFGDRGGLTRRPIAVEGGPGRSGTGSRRRSTVEPGAASARARTVRGHLRPGRPSPRRGATSSATGALAPGTAGSGHRRDP